MALSAAETARYAFDLIRYLEPRPGRLQLAIRLALICALTGLIVEIYQTPDAALTMYVALFLNQKDRPTSLVLSVALTLVMTFIITLVFLVARTVIDDPMWRLISMAAIASGMLFLASASKLKPVGPVIALIAGYALSLLGDFPVSASPTRALLYAWLLVGIPAGVSLVVNLLFPSTPQWLVEQTIAWRLRLAASMLRGWDRRTRARFTEALREGTTQIDAWLRLASVEKSASSEDVAALRQAARSSIALLSAIDMMDRNPATAFPLPLRVRLGQALNKMATVLERGDLPIEVSLNRDDIHEPERLPGIVLAQMDEVLLHFADSPEARAAAPKPAAEPQGFFAKDAFTNPDHVRYALKTTAAAMTCYVIYTLFDWPGIHTCFITCFIVSLGTTAETFEKLTLRVLGCLVGAALGFAAILYLLPELTSIGGLMIVIFLGALGAAYVAAGSPRISYAGFQIAFAFFLCVVQGPAPAFDVVIARDRVIGILLGTVVTFVIMTRFSPVSVTGRIDPAIADLLRTLGSLATTADAGARRALAAQGQSALGAIETDIRLARFESSAVRPSEEWLRSRESAAEELGALEAPLLLAPDEVVAARLERLAEAVGTPGATQTPARRESLRAGPFSALAMPHLQGLERALTFSNGNELAAGQHAPA